MTWPFTQILPLCDAVLAAEQLRNDRHFLARGILPAQFVHSRSSHATLYRLHTTNQQQGFVRPSFALN